MEAMWAELQKNTNEAVQQMEKTPLELAQLCFYFERNGSLPELPVQLIQQITELLKTPQNSLLLSEVS